MDTVVANPDFADGADLLDLGAGDDSASYEAASADVTATLDGVADDGPEGDGDNLVAIEHLTGGSGDDTIAGSGGADSLEGGGGRDVVTGNGGPDFLSGDAGNDTLLGGAGEDSGFGEEGEDVVGGGQGVDDLEGGTGDDRVSGNGGNDQAEGGLGADVVRGGGGRDVVYSGNTGADGDKDKLDCGAGKDGAVAEHRDSTTGCERVVRGGLLKA